MSGEPLIVAMTYAESLRDSFVVPPDDPIRKALWERLGADLEQEMDRGSPDFSALLRIEMGLVDVLDDESVPCRLWQVEDRFARVVPLETRTKRETGLPPRTDAQWKDPAFLRRQMRVMLDAIHANYLVNAARERLVGRLKAILWAGLAAIAAVAAIVFVATEHAGWTAFTLIFLAGGVGAMFSVHLRLQAAVETDALTKDGVFQLIGLRTAWISVLSSLVMGGLSALVVYAIVAGGVLQMAQPALAQTAVVQPPVGPAGLTSGEPRSPAATLPVAGTAAVTNAATSPAIGAEPARPAATLPGTGAAAVTNAATPPAAGTEPATPAAPAAGASATTGAKAMAEPAANAPNAFLQLRAGAAPELCPTGGGECTPLAARIFKALGLDGFGSLCLLLVLATVAGFAERLVPDILSRLSKRAGANA